MVYDSLDSLPLEQSHEESFEPIVKQLIRDTGKDRENPARKAALPLIQHPLSKPEDHSFKEQKAQVTQAPVIS